mmetsp:Transcript_3269/g.5228  ORF Transcript_3269/g.5228 Transcript_3269/m.5228 type:complete len:113 (+) Transcript_3269:72-410(+)
MIHPSNLILRQSCAQRPKFSPPFVSRCTQYLCLLGFIGFFFSLNMCRKMRVYIGVSSKAARDFIVLCPEGGQCGGRVKSRKTVILLNPIRSPKSCTLISSKIYKCGLNSFNA